MHHKPQSNSHDSILALALIAACLLCAPAAPMFDQASAQNSAASNGKIAFVSNRNGPPGEFM